MKQGWIGVVAGLAVGLTAVFMTNHKPDEPPPRLSAVDGKAALTLCDPGGTAFGLAYDNIASPVHKYLTTDPSKALEAARGQVANLIDSRMRACYRVLDIKRDVGSSFDDPKLPQVPAYAAHLKLAREQLNELITALQSPQASDAPQKLDTLDSTIHAH